MKTPIPPHVHTLRINFAGCWLCGPAASTWSQFCRAIHGAKGGKLLIQPREIEPGLMVLRVSKPRRKGKRRAARKAVPVLN